MRHCKRCGCCCHVSSLQAGLCSSCWQWGWANEQARLHAASVRYCDSSPTASAYLLLFRAIGTWLFLALPCKGGLVAIGHNSWSWWDLNCKGYHCLLFWQTTLVIGCHLDALLLHLLSWSILHNISSTKHKDAAKQHTGLIGGKHEGAVNTESLLASPRLLCLRVDMSTSTVSMALVPKPCSMTIHKDAWASHLQIMSDINPIYCTSRDSRPNQLTTVWRYLLKGCLSFLSYSQFLATSGSPAERNRSWA